jgi:hypothetical protein
VKPEDPVRLLTSRSETSVVVDEHLETHGLRHAQKGKVSRTSEDRATHIEAPPDGIARRVELTVNEERAFSTKSTTHARFDVVDAP